MQRGGERDLCYYFAEPMHADTNIRLSPKNYRRCARSFISMAAPSTPHVCEWLIRKLPEIAARQSFEMRAYCVMPDHNHSPEQAVLQRATC